MLATLLAHQWKESRRSATFQKSMAVNIILGFFIVYFLLCFLVIGFFIDAILKETFPGLSPVQAFDGFLLFYFIVDLFIRFILQELPVLAIQPYLHLPVKKANLIHYVLFKSVPSLFNFWQFLILIPFMVKVLVPAYGAGVALLWLISIVAFIFANNFLCLYFKRQLSNNPRLTLIFALVIILLILLDYLGFLSLRQTSAVAFGYLMQHPWAVAFPLVLCLLLYVLNYKFLRAHTYPEEMAVRQTTSVTGNDIAFLNRFGVMGKLIALELKLMWRHKRSKSLIYMSVFFLLYGLVFYRNEAYQDGFVMYIFVGIVMTGMLVFNYGQFVPSWQSGHFDALLTKRISPYQFYQAKFWLFVPIIAVSFLMTLPYGLFGIKILLINLAAFLFNIGINIFVVFYFSVLNKSRIDLSKSAAFNYQGVGASKFVMMLPLLLLPMLIYAPFGYMGVPNWGIVAIGAVGLTGFIFHQSLLQLTANRFLAHKYKIAAGFRQA